MKASAIKEALQRIGLSRHEAEVFAHLALSGEATALEIARASGVNRVQTYRVLDSLDGRGLVEVSLGRPRRYAARALDEVFDMIAEEKQAELEALRAVRQGVLSAWPKRRRLPGPKPNVRLQVIQGRAQIYRSMRRLIAGAEREVLAFTTTKGLQRSYRSGINEVLLEAMGRGVKPRLLVDVNAANAALMSRVADRVPLRHLDRQRGRFIILDRESVFAFLVQDERTIRGEGETAMWTNTPDFVKAHVDFFEKAWGASTPAKRRLRSLRSA